MKKIVKRCVKCGQLTFYDKPFSPCLCEGCIDREEMNGAAHEILLDGCQDYIMYNRRKDNANKR